MVAKDIDTWMEKLGYLQVEPSLHRPSSPHSPDHHYAIELSDMLREDGEIRAEAIFDVQGVPTVAFFDRNGKHPLSDSDIERIRQKLWNQNLISVVLVANGTELEPYAVQRKGSKVAPVQLSNSHQSSEYSAAEIARSDIRQRLPDWFQYENRVDQKLLDNLRVVVGELSKQHMDTSSAQMLIGQVMFISYLEHRGIVGDIYRKKRKICTFYEMVKNKNGKIISKFIKHLQKDFNGDFLEGKKAGDLWSQVSSIEFDIIQDFLEYVDLKTGQQNFWNYDFSKIPVELISGIYESFLGGEQEKLAAYYTPRHLAVLTLDQALLDSSDISKEIVFDGACGSGILLTTFFRKLLGVSESKAGKQLSLKRRCKLLVGHVFGSDISEAAVRVTAFSLYLSVLERLEPSDVLALQERDDVKLPPLRGSNLFCGAKGDFFSHNNPHLKNRKFTLLISNPPWKEPSAKEITSADIWAKESELPRTLRQMSVDYSQRAFDYMTPNGRVCLIVPASQLLAPSSLEFMRSWLTRFKPSRMINFGDFQQLLFSASTSCMVVVASPRKSFEIPMDEKFEYWVPKVDVSLAFGRLSLQSADRHTIQTQAVYENNSRLVTLMWGSDSDIALLARLKSFGTFGDIIRSKRWFSRKGVHLVDNSREPVSAKPLQGLPFITPELLKQCFLTIPESEISRFPSDIDEVASINDSLLSVFNGPRILFPDGFDREREIRAAFYEKAAIFTVSIGVIAGPKDDTNLLKFAAAFLRSKLARYFLIMTSWQVLCDRNAARMKNVYEFPFFPPEFHESPKTANIILKRVSEVMESLNSDLFLKNQVAIDKARKNLDSLVYKYFGLQDREIVLVEEAVKTLMPSIRPRSHKSLFTPMQQRATKAEIGKYTDRLAKELGIWVARTGGYGQLDIETVFMQPKNIGSLGVVRLEPSKGKGRKVKTVSDDEHVFEVLNQLESRNISQFDLTDSLHFVSDVAIWADGALYIARPLLKRFWLERTAIRDARKIVKCVQQGSIMDGWS